MSAEPEQIPVHIAGQAGISTATFAKRHPELASKGFNNFLIYDGICHAFFRYLAPLCRACAMAGHSTCDSCNAPDKLALEVLDELRKSRGCHHSGTRKDMSAAEVAKLSCVFGLGS